MMKAFVILHFQQLQESCQKPTHSETDKDIFINKIKVLDKVFIDIQSSVIFFNFQI